MRIAARTLGVALAAAGLALGAAPRAFGQGAVRVEAGEVTDDRFSPGLLTGSLQVKLKLEGDGRSAAKSARVLVKEARDDSGASLLRKSDGEPDFDRLDNSWQLLLRLENPSRRATRFSVRGAVELFVPDRDPAAVVKVEKALAKLDQPLASKGLRAARVTVTPMSKAAYAEQQKKQKLTEADYAEIRAEGKKRGMTDEQVDFQIEMAKAFEGMEEPPLPESAVILTGPAADFERIQEVAVLGADGKEIHVGGTSGGRYKTTATRVLFPAGDPGPSASLVFTLITDKARVSVPFDLKDVPLP